MIETVKEAKEYLLDFYANGDDLKKAIKSGEIEDAISEIADQTVDVYNGDRLEWMLKNFGEAVEFIDEAADEFGMPEGGGGSRVIFDLIGVGQFLFNRELLEEAAEELKEELEEGW